MSPEILFMWVIVACGVGTTIVMVIVDLFKYKGQCRHDWSTWSTPEKPEMSYAPSYGQQTKYCKKCNQVEIRQIK